MGDGPPGSPPWRYQASYLHGVQEGTRYVALQTFNTKGSGVDAGPPARLIAENCGFSESTARRRISEARDHIRDALKGHAADGLWASSETAIDPVLERSQQMFEATFAPSPGPDADRGPRR